MGDGFRILIETVAGAGEVTARHRTANSAGSVTI